MRFEGDQLPEALDCGIGSDRLVAHKVRRSGEPGAIFAPATGLFA